MPPSGTRRSVKKSRGGCTRCKTQHLKCDEKKPECGRCERLGVKCPGYTQSLKWSTKHEVNRWRVEKPNASSATTSGQASFDQPSQSDLEWLDFSYATPADDAVDLATPSGGGMFGLDSVQDWTPTDLTSGGIFSTQDRMSLAHLIPQQTSKSLSQPMLQSLGVRRSQSSVPQALSHQPSDLLSFYFQVMPMVYSTFDSQKNPFRTAVSNLFSHSLPVNLAAQSMAAAFLSEVHPRFAAIGSDLRRQVLQLVQSESSNDYDVLLALMMCGPTGNWHQTADLGVVCYKAMKDRLQSMSEATDPPAHLAFFQEAMIHWEMFIAFVADSKMMGPSISYTPPIPPQSKHEPHPWTGVGRETSQIVANIGKLVRNHRLNSYNQQFITQAYIRQMSDDLNAARELEGRLLACEHPDENDIVPTEDAATPTWHIRAIAELNRYAGLLSIYRVFPDLLTERLRSENATNSLQDNSLIGLTDLSLPDEPHEIHSKRNEWLTQFAMEALRLLQSIPAESGTKDFQPFIIVALASELVCEPYPQPDNDSTNVSPAFAEIAIMRKFVSDRLTTLLRLIPPKPIRACLDIVKETWRRIDSGEKDVYWLDVVIQNGWETIMA